MLSKIAHGRVRMMLKCLFGEVVSKTLAAEMSDVCVYSYKRVTSNSIDQLDPIGAPIGVKKRTMFARIPALTSR